MASDLNALPLPELYAQFERTGMIRRLLELARDEDLGLSPTRAPNGRLRGGVGDVTTAACIAPGRRAVAHLVARAPGVISGLACVPELLSIFAPGCAVELRARDGERVSGGSVLAVFRGALDETLELERTMLNLVGRLCGVASRTAEFVALLPKGSRARLYDTRKTTPGLRVLEKYAVRCGGGLCHRLGLHDAVLIKDNHLAGVGVRELAAFVAKAAAEARRLAPGAVSFVEVEVDTLDQFRALLGLAPGVVDIVLLDNMGPALLREAARLRDAEAPSLQLEASGGITKDSLADVAATGVDRISTGSLTHSAVSLDVALDVVEATGFELGTRP